MRLSFILLFCLALSSPIQSQTMTGVKPMFDRWFYPNKGLPRNAASPLFQDSLSLRPFQVHQPAYFANHQINQPLTAQYQLLKEEDNLPLDGFTLEFWLLDHVNQPLGLEVFVGEASVFAVWDRSYLFSSKTVKQKPWSRYWTHLVVSYAAGELDIWENGELVSSEKTHITSGSIYMQSYMDEEPYMELDDYIKHLAIYPVGLNEAAIQASFHTHQDMRNTGKRFPDTFHFMAEPYLFSPNPTSMQVTFETDRAADASVLYGTQLPLESKLSVSPTSDNIFTVTIPELVSGEAYFYQVIAEDETGKTLDSGVLTFRTTPENESPVVFAVVSDTEARPAINEQIGLKLWDERPDFVIHMGDITDGGKENDKWQWTQEYFPGSSALTSRIPMAPVAGNGEGDLFWYNKYHPQAAPDGYYKFTYGSGEFYMMNSNDMDGLQPGGKQYEWLKKSLEESTSSWRFVSMHHAPYSSDEDDYGNTWKNQSTHGDRRLQPLIRLMEENGVEVMFFGHLHTYMRTFPMRNDKIDLKDGIHFVQVGGMGGNLEDFAPNRIGFAEKTYRGFHYVTVSLTSEKFQLRMYNTEGAILDLLEINK